MDVALRVTFEYDGDRIAVRSIRRVAMRVPPGQAARSLRAAGQWVELRDAEGNVLYRRRAEVIPRSLEYPTGDPDRPIGRARAPDRGVASFLVPAHDRASSVAVVETPPDTGEAAVDAELEPTELLVVELDAGHDEGA